VSPRGLPWSGGPGELPPFPPTLNPTLAAAMLLFQSSALAFRFLACKWVKKMYQSHLSSAAPRETPVLYTRSLSRCGSLELMKARLPFFIANNTATSKALFFQRFSWIVSNRQEYFNEMQQLEVKNGCNLKARDHYVLKRSKGRDQWSSTAVSAASGSIRVSHTSR